MLGGCKDLNENNIKPKQDGIAVCSSQFSMNTIVISGKACISCEQQVHDLGVLLEAIDRTVFVKVIAALSTSGRFGYNNSHHTPHTIATYLIWDCL